MFLMHDSPYWNIKSHWPYDCCEVMSCFLFLLVISSRGLCSQLPLSLGGSTSSSVWLTLAVSDSETNKSQGWELIGWVLLILHESSSTWGKNKSSGNIYISQVESEVRQCKETEIKHTDIHCLSVIHFFSAISGQRWIKVRPWALHFRHNCKLYSLSPLIQ